MNALTLAKEIADEITGWRRDLPRIQIGRASCRERV